MEVCDESVVSSGGAWRCVAERGCLWLDMVERTGGHGGLWRGLVGAWMGVAGRCCCPTDDSVLSVSSSQGFGSVELEGDVV